MIVTASLNVSVKLPLLHWTSRTVPVEVVMQLSVVSELMSTQGALETVTRGKTSEIEKQNENSFILREFDLNPNKSESINCHFPLYWRRLVTHMLTIDVIISYWLTPMVKITLNLNPKDT